MSDIIKNYDPWFRLHLGVRNDLSGQPYGFWFMWRPRELIGPHRHSFPELLYSYKLGVYWYPWWRHSWWCWTDIFPRFG